MPKIYNRWPRREMGAQTKLVQAEVALGYSKQEARNLALEGVWISVLAYFLRIRLTYV